ncbi:TPA: hypothetical protein EYN98_13820 [Candidatus Poribacteria bacterium]|nr:hypothetical protein [Candidatus Poribacteria bacterium]HIN76569.1 hypothetical protein [Rhodospirillales bacterium]
MPSTITKEVNKISIKNSGNEVTISKAQNKVVIKKDNYENTVLINPPNAKVQVISRQNKANFTKTVNKIKLQGVGVQGIPGPGGDVANITKTYISGEAIGGYKAVKLDTDGLLYLADNDTIGDISKVVGISTSAGGVGASIQVLEFGFKANSSLNGFSPGSVFVGNSGTLTQTRPLTGFVKKLGFVPQSGEIHVNPAQSICLS